MKTKLNRKKQKHIPFLSKTNYIQRDRVSRTNLAPALSLRLPKAQNDLPLGLTSQYTCVTSTPLPLEGNPLSSQRQSRRGSTPDLPSHPSLPDLHNSDTSPELQPHQREEDQNLRRVRETRRSALATRAFLKHPHAHVHVHVR